MCIFLLILVICGCFVFVKAPVGGAVCASTWRGSCDPLERHLVLGRLANTNTSLTAFRIKGTLSSVFLATSEECSKQRVINSPFSYMFLNNEKAPSAFKLAILFSALHPLPPLALSRQIA